METSPQDIQVSEGVDYLLKVKYRESIIKLNLETIETPPRL